ncbi:hypothetical protein [Deinococcus marmoris]|uniref:Uncharacterized protein n=1 Tax=Deinococcus marmoris TaxID=249408 RepID=A0A1U7P308_9DEIO|nr:hypothetical protein [Deinococcus marmoris]OLV19552.1 hypothetical protein BOO71_0002395 [Deinococcus marmoris]
MPARFWSPKYWVTVGGISYCAPLVLESEDLETHPACNACMVWMKLNPPRKR